MRAHLLSESKQSLGGGFSFIRNFKKGATTHEDIQMVESWQEAEVILIPSSSMVTKETVKEIEQANIPYVLRVDNVPRNSRNRNTGTPRLQSFAQRALAVVYQSEWAKDYLSPFTGQEGPVIYNGIDTGIFSETGPLERFGGNPIFLYARFNRDETKSWERAQYRFQMIAREQPDAKFIIIGQFSRELIEANFDFFMDESINYLGIIESANKMAAIMRGCDVLLAPYFNDAYSNTIQEALACGLEIEFDASGGTPELIKNGVRSCEQMVADYLEVFKYVLGGGDEWK